MTINRTWAVALANGILQSGSLLIDEPTAALDPIAEAEIYTEFEKRGKAF